MTSRVYRHNFQELLTEWVSARIRKSTIHQFFLLKFLMRPVTIHSPHHFFRCGFPITREESERLWRAMDLAPDAMIHFSGLIRHFRDDIGPVRAMSGKTSEAAILCCYCLVDNILMSVSTDTENKGSESKAHGTAQETKQLTEAGKCKSRTPQKSGRKSCELPIILARIRPQVRLL